jgi:hypothetical protein
LVPFLTSLPLLELHQEKFLCFLHQPHFWTSTFWVRARNWSSLK